MTDYTPTPEAVANAYVTGMLVCRDRINGTVSPKLYRAQFDRMLAEVVRAAKEEEWDQGYRQGWGDRDEDFHAQYIPSGFEQGTPNPYRKESSDV